MAEVDSGSTSASTKQVPQQRKPHRHTKMMITQTLRKRIIQQSHKVESTSARQLIFNTNASLTQCLLVPLNDNFDTNTPNVFFSMYSIGTSPPHLTYTRSRTSR